MSAMKNVMGLFVLTCWGLVFTPAAVACPASYVKSLGQNTGSHAEHQKAQQVADQYMENRGLDPQSPIGQVVKPYVTGTAVIEDQFFNDFDLDTDSVSHLVDEALGPYAGTTIGENDFDQSSYGGHGMMPTYLHFHRHFGHGVHDAAEEVPEETVPLGG